MADPYDDDDFFDNPETLNILAAVEERAIQASQAPAQPKPRFSQPVRHVLAKPRNSPASSASSSRGRGARQGLTREPRPVNTEPRVQKSGFGWEEGGKRSIDGNLERHVDAIKKREAYWSGQQEQYEQESAPPDIVMDGTGRYELGAGSADEAVITDNRRAQPAVLGESLGLAGPGPAGGPKRKQSEDAIIARRKAIAAAAAAANTNTNTNVNAHPPPFTARQSLSRSNSASSTSREVTPKLAVEGQRQAMNTNLQPPQPQTNGQKFGSNRSLSRSLSAGAQIFHRPHHNAAAGPSRLPTIPSQRASQTSSGGELGPPPASQGSLARMATIELEVERRKRQELEAELAALKAAQTTGSTTAGPSRIPIEKENARDAGATEARIKELQGQVWAAKGEAETMRRAQREEHQKHLAELERLRVSLLEKDAEIKEREAQQKKALESMRHQAVFSNHAVLNSAVKNRPQSQRFPAASQSQFRAMPTPMRNGSPSRRRSDADVEVTPLVRSVKGKGSIPPPHFGGFNNAFAVSPLVGAGGKRQKTADPSPRPSPSKGPPPSPFQASPTKSHYRGSSPAVGDEAEDAAAGVDWGPGDGDADMVLDGEDGVGRREEKAELLYHLFNHVPISTFQLPLGLTTEPTIYRIINYRPPPSMEGHEIYTQRCADLLKACGDPEMGFEQLVEVFARVFADMLLFLVGALKDVEKVTLDEIAALFNVISLSATTALLFPTMVPVLASTSVTETCKDLVNLVYPDQVKLTELRGRVEQNSKDPVQTDEWYLELVDVLVGLCETMSFHSERTIWQGDELVDIIFGLTETHQNTLAVRRGLELFYTASCHGSNFRPLITASDKHKMAGSDQSPLIERMSRYLITPLASAKPSEMVKMNVLIIRGLCMLSMSHPDAIILMGQRSILVAALVLVLQRESTKLYGVHAVPHSTEDALSLLMPTLALLHHLVFPSPPPSPESESPSGSQSQSLPARDEDVPVGIDLPERLHSASATREFNGLQHMFVSALGCMAYGQVGEEMVSEVDQRSIQFLAGDLLENVVEGPEGDAIYELYVVDDEDGEVPREQGRQEGDDNDDGDEDAVRKRNGGADVDEEVYNEFDRGEVIVNDDDDDD